MSRKRNAANLNITQFKGNAAAARNETFYGRNYFDRIAPATKIAKAQSEKYRSRKK